MRILIALDRWQLSHGRRIARTIRAAWLWLVGTNPSNGRR